MKNTLYKLHAPTCALPGCDAHVGYHKKFLKKDKTVGYKWKTFCEPHRKFGNTARAVFFKARGGCENRDGRLGFTCGDPNTPSLTVDHWDGDNANDDEDNLVVLCANCHNQKSILFNDFANRYNFVPVKFTELFEENP